MDQGPFDVNFVTPLPPLRTEIANHSALVLQALARQASVTAWTDQRQWEAAVDYAVRPFSIHEVPVAQLSASGATFYNIGNNIQFHAAIWEASRRAPGIVILHDTALQHFFQGFAHSPPGASDYVAMMRRSHGADGEAAAIARINHNQGDMLDMARRYPMTQAAVEGSRGVVVHNEAELAGVRGLGRAPVWYVPLAAAAGPAAIRPAARRQDGVLRLIVFGHLDRNRRLPEILRALAALPERERFRLDVYGDIVDPAAAAADIAAHGLGHQVTIHGYVPAAELDDALAGADMALNLRHPTMGEASSSQLRIWANALPSLVTRAGWYAGLSPTMAAFVDPGQEVADIQRHLSAFASDSAPYVRRGIAGRGHVDAAHRATGYASALLEIAREVSGPRMMTVRVDTPPLGTAATLYLDVTDLLHYASEHRAVSGIQRVQIGVIGQFLVSPGRAPMLAFTVFSTETGRFHPVDHADMAWLVDNLTFGADPDARLARLAAILRAIPQSAAFAPGETATILITGGFWCFPGFLAALRQLQANFGLRYVQLFYDAVPTITPEYCPSDSVAAFNRSLVHMIGQADAICAISHHAAGELRMLASRLGLDCPETAVVRLGTQPHYGEMIVDDADLPPGLGEFVLCVGTIEPRKNHLYLFHLWRRLLARTGRRTPRLVCAGRLGWLTDELQRHLHASRNLDGHFVMLPDVSDAQLRALYRHCRFTIYPSFYEGWGLPVSESLSTGRLCVTSRVSALPEAGGEWAAYLDPFDLGSGFTVVCDLIDHPEQVALREAAIRDGFRATTWAEAAEALWTTVDRLVAELGPARRDQPPMLPLGQQHRMRPDVPTVGHLAIAREEMASCAFGKILQGRDWNVVERWGVWASGPIARLAFETETIDDEAIAYVRTSLPGSSGGNECRIRVNGAEAGAIGLSPGLQTIRVPIGRGGRVHIELALAQEERAPGDLRRLGLGLHRVSVCRTADLATRVSFLEER